MATRLATADADLLLGDAARSRSRHSCSLALVSRDEPWDIDRVMEFVDARLADAPRFRQRIRHVPFGLARAVWVDDPDFDLSFHVRRSALPAPGGMRQLADLVARLVDRPLEAGRPLWELYLIEGLADGRLAILTKTHHVLLGGPNAVDLAQVLMTDERASADVDEVATWTPVPSPGDGVLVLDALITIATDPLELVRRSTRLVNAVERATRGLVGAASLTLLRPPGGLSEMFRTSRPRGSRVGLASFPLDQARTIAREHDCKVNDVVLAVLCGALRSWILSCGHPLSTSDTLRAIVPMAVTSESGSSDVEGAEASAEATSAEIASALIGMPVGEPNPRMRLAQISRESATQRYPREAVGAKSLAKLSGFAPPTLHALGSRAAIMLPSDSYDLVVTNAPGPQHKMFWGDGELAEVYPVPALLDGQALAVSMSSYSGTVYCGFTSDRQAVPDVEEIGELISSALDELAGSAR
ncbi:wax ester/triacylglycerol synthase family O-acyltransferase [Dietzia sp. PP-33]|uniref:wax ester/triacylglycerol synthase family O-acyltransferase n=1 Tax=Dietzia sp. PP-33 TaxID=2957500 RepID=UPI0029AF82D3|nr:wax ester/triacylglycerol synthase family O-acyltransferase [Dietzia sp. PP-33]MDX2356668.1 wax ester/triacylglycerol synthase family O-acyltransferase [Dietzia sp. PP-33]